MQINFTPAIARLLLAFLVLATALPAAGDDVLPPCWRGQSGSTFQHWRFDTGANPASPEQLDNTNGVAQAIIQPGFAAAGWQSQLFLFGTNQGIWDLGKSGVITLDIPNTATPSAPSKLVWVQVYQYQDSLYNQLASVSIAGASRVSTQVQTNTATSFGGRWVTEKSVWLFAAHPASETIVINGPTNSAAIDQILVDTLGVNLACPPDIMLAADPGQCGRSNVTWTLPSLPACVAGSPVCSPPGGSTFPVGTTVVTCQTLGSSGNAITCSFNVVIDDPVQPSLTIAASTVGSAIITWAQTCATWTLEETLELGPTANWLPVGTPIVPASADFQTTVSTAVGNRFYRLKKL